MPLFRYQAFAQNGKKVTGVIDADSFALAKERLLKQEMLLTTLSLHEKKEIILPKPLLLTFTRELAQLLEAGLPLYESLLTIEEKYRRQKCHPLFLDLCDRLKSGASLSSSSLMRYPKSFDAVYLSLVKAGEESGSLAEVFEELSTLITKQLRLRKLLISSLTYPMILLSFCTLVTAGLLFFVVPSMQELFEGRDLHPLTQFVLNLSRFVNAHGYLLLLLMGGFGALLFSFFRSEKGRAAIQSICLKMPLVKTLLIRSALTRFSHCASLLIESGVPLLNALSLSRETMKLKLLEDVIGRAEQKIVEGKALSKELKDSPLIPSLVVRMLSIAEETGRMGPIFHKLAEIYDEELEKNLTQLSAYLQPALLLTMGAIVGLVVLSILLPLTDVSSFLR